MGDAAQRHRRCRVSDVPLEPLKDRGRPRQRYCKAEDAGLLPRVRRMVDERPTYGYRRITALLNRELAAEGRPRANHKRLYRLMKVHKLMLARHTGHRPGRPHDGKVMVMASNLRWCSDGFEFTCWNGEIVPAAFVMDAHDREAIAWAAVANAGISGSNVRDMMLEAVEKRFGDVRAPKPVEWCRITADNLRMGSSLSGASDSRLMYGRLTAHSSFCSSIRAPTWRTTARSLGKMPMTSARRLISPFKRSSGLAEAICGQCSRGNVM